MPGKSPYNPKAATTNGGTFTAWKDVHGYTTNGGTRQPAKKVLVRNSSNNGWIEVWNARPELSGVTASAATHDIDESKIDSSVKVLGHYLNTDVYFYYRTGTGAWTSSLVSSLTGSTILGAEQTVSTTIYGLSENTTYEYYWYASNDGGSAQTSTGSTTTPYNCTEGASGFSAISCSDCTDSETTGCGTCGTKTRYRYRTKYGKTGCTNTYYSAYGAYPDWSTVACSEGTGTWEDVTGTLPSTGTFAGVCYVAENYGFMGISYGVRPCSNVQCEWGYPAGTATKCCGGNGIRYYRAQQCTQTGSQRMVFVECYSFY